MQKIITLGNVDLNHDPKTNMIIIVYRGYTKSSDFRAVNEKALDVIKQHKVSKLLVDQRKMGVLTSEDINWLANDYYPRSYAILRGHMKTALVLPESAFGEMSLKKMVNEFDKSLSNTTTYAKKDVEPSQASYFPTVEAAHSWLMEN